MMASQKTGTSKDRTTNFSKEETVKLTCLLKDYSIITSKRTDHASNQQKDAAWRSLAEKFNSDAVVYRNVKQLQQKFNNMKKIARKEMSAEKNGRKQTGGGPPPPKPSETTEWLNTIMGESISGLPAIYDSDALVDGDTTLEMSNTAECTISLDLMENEMSDAGGTANTSLNECNNLLNTEVLDDIETDADSKKVDITFDNSTPKALLRKPISKQLSSPHNKRKKCYTPFEARKRIVTHFEEKKEFLTEKKSREEQIKKYAQEEHQQNITHKADKYKREIEFMEQKHALYMEQQKEMHELEVVFKKNIQELLLEKVKLEILKIKKCSCISEQ
ncbi:unnamed protein product [Parnassius apollo]|uniref:Regulatory protein zeste n=1 Tax=Parnassius apollo TaxID=110799 RepID=A0A8S3WXZ9_PARAO|nr:unnamed protein product [Parnassius apollo]CAG5042615.1 unnamed protein product [Parnassius apollo]